MTNILFRLTAATDVGRVRTNNEDNFILNKDLSHEDWFLPEKDSQPLQLSQEGCILAVADGMGGLNAGEVASEIAISTVKEMFSSASLQKISQSEKDIEKFMRKCVLTADEQIKKRVKKDPKTSGMGTTLVVAWICNGRIYFVWCGDSRGYIFNPASGLKRITKDHSYVQQLVDEGKLDPDLAFDHPNSNIITRCLGDFEGKAIPDFRSLTLAPGDFVMLCSDGLCGLCRDEEIMQTFRENYVDLEQCKKELINHAMDAGGYDNCTLTLCEIVSIDGKTCEKKPDLSNSLSNTLNEFVIKKPVEVENTEESAPEKEPIEEITDEKAELKNNKPAKESEEDQKDEDKQTEAEPEKTEEPQVKSKKRGVSVPKGFIVLFVLVLLAALALSYMHLTGIELPDIKIFK